MNGLPPSDAGQSLGAENPSPAADHLGSTPIGNNPDRLTVGPRALTGAGDDVQHLLANQRLDFYKQGLDALTKKTEAHGEAITKVQTAVAALEERAKHMALREEVSSTKNVWLVNLWGVLLVALAAGSFMPTIWNAIFGQSIGFQRVAPEGREGPSRLQGQ